MSRIVYFDNFTHANSNGYWLAAFKKYGEVRNYDVIKINREPGGWVEIPKEVKLFKPSHAHFGGSVKHGSAVSVGFIRWLREEFPEIRITYFFGDGYNKMKYYEMLETYVDNIFMSNTGWCRNEKYVHMPCPAESRHAIPWKEKKRYDVVFIGNNYNSDRMRTLASVNEKFNLTVFGGGWKPPFECPGKISYEEYPGIVSQSKIVLGDPAGPLCKHSTGGECLKGDPDRVYTKGLCRMYTCSAYEELTAYLSNRLANTLIAGTVHLVPYVKGLEDYWENFKDLVWYNNIEERNRLIEDLLADPNLCKTIAQSGQRKILDNYTYDRCAGQFLATVNVLKLRKATDKDAARYCKLRNGKNTYKWFFSEEKFDLKKTIAWLNALPNTDEVYMVELDGKAVGTCSLYNIDWKKKSAEVGRIIVAEDQRGKGLGARTLDKITDMATSKGLRLLYANIKKDNISSQRAFEKAGYVQQSETFYWKAL